MGDILLDALYNSVSKLIIYFVLLPVGIMALAYFTFIVVELIKYAAANKKR